MDYTLLPKPLLPSWFLESKKCFPNSNLVLAELEVFTVAFLQCWGLNLWPCIC
jgi:hypothetical protein